MRITIIGTGWIAEKMAVTVSGMPHSETLRIMQLMDNLRKEWGVVYPFDK